MMSASWLNKMVYSTLACAAFGCGAQTQTPKTSEQTQTQASAQTEAAVAVAPKAVNAGKCPNNLLIDDFEDGNNRANESDARGGYIYTYKDDSSSIEPQGDFTPAEGGASDSQFSARMSGQLGNAQYTWAGLGVSLTDPKLPYDASCCAGVSFMGKKVGDGVSRVRLKVGDWQTVPEGGLCKSCYNDFGSDFVFTEEWQEFSVLFADMKQEPYWGEPRPAIDTSALYQLQWQVNQSGSAFDIRIDDVKFVGCKQ